MEQMHTTPPERSIFEMALGEVKGRVGANEKRVDRLEEQTTARLDRMEAKIDCLLAVQANSAGAVGLGKWFLSTSTAVMSLVISAFAILRSYKSGM